MKKTARRTRPVRQFTALIQRDGKWFIAFCPEMPGANGQGRTKAACLKNLAAAIKLLLDIQEEELAASGSSALERELIEVA